MYDNESLIPLLDNQDAVISTFNSLWKNPTCMPAISAAKKAKIKYILLVGGASSLVLPSGKLIYDSIPDKKSAVKGPLELLEEFKGERELNWSFVSPPLSLAPG